MKTFAKLGKPLTFSQEEINDFESRDKKKRSVQTFEFDNRDNPNEPHKFYVVAPSYQTITNVADEVRSKGTEEANYTLLSACVLAGPVASLDTDDSLVLGLLSELNDLMEVKKNR